MPAIPTRAAIAAALVCLLLPTPPATAEEICRGYGPQTPRDIGQVRGTNPVRFALAPPPEAMNLCNIHAHAQAEHAGPDFSLALAGGGTAQGFRCNETAQLSAVEVMAPLHHPETFHGVRPGDTLEVHWVYTSCDVDPGEGLGACLSDSCANPQLRVEMQVFLLVNDLGERDFRDYDHAGQRSPSGLHQPKALPRDTGVPIQFAGSTTGPKYDQTTCSPMQVTWSVRPECTRLDINSLHAWAAEGNRFNETHAHGVRQLVTAPELLSPIQ